MQDSLEKKLEKLEARQEEIHGLLATPEVIKDQNRFRDLGREAAEIAPIVSCYREHRATLLSMGHAKDMLKDSDRAIRELANEEIEAARQKQEALELELQKLLLPRDPADKRNIFLEIRAGTGGEEAALFAADLLRMYSRYAEKLDWKIELLNAAESDLYGYKAVVMRVLGAGAYSRLKFESGAHRVQRVPETESQGRIHTSACTVAILPEADEIDAIEINPNDLKTDTFRASGAGGQHVNKTDSAIRLTHLPTGLVVECQDERSQHKNRARALSLLQAKLLAAEREKQAAEIAENRRNLIGSGDRSERIRTYNFPQGRVTDHRINLTLYRLEAIMQGELDAIIEPLISEHQADQLAALSAAG